MKKIMFLILFAVLTIMLCACENNKKTDENEEAFECANNKYEISVRLDDTRITCEQTLYFVNDLRDGLDELKFHIYANAYRKDAQNKAYKGTLLSYGEFLLLGIEVDGINAEAEFSEDKDIMSVKIPTVELGDKSNVKMLYEVYLPHGKGRLGYYDGVYKLSYFYPVLCAYEDGKYREDRHVSYGDSFFTLSADYSVSVNVPKSMKVAVSGDVICDNESGERRIVKSSGNNMRDIAAVVSERFSVIQRKAGDTEISYFYYADKQPEYSISIIENALKVFGKLFVEYPYARYSMVEVPFENGGMEYSALAYISDGSIDRESVIVHETAHQWWYGLVGSDSITSAYIDEGLATFCETHYFKETGNEERFRTIDERLKREYSFYLAAEGANAEKRLCRGLAVYSEKQYYILCYNRAYMMFSAIYDIVGRENFYASLKEICIRYAGGIISIDSLSAVFFDKSGKDLRPIFDGFIYGDIKDAFSEYCLKIR